MIYLNQRKRHQHDSASSRPGNTSASRCANTAAAVSTAIPAASRLSGAAGLRQQSVPNPYQVPYQQERSSIALSVVAMVLGIISLLGFIFNLFAAALGLIAIILGGISVAIEPRGRGFAITGIIAGALAIIVGIGLFVWVLNNEDFLKELEQQSKHSAAPLDSLVVSVNK